MVSPLVTPKVKPAIDARGYLSVQDLLAVRGLFFMCALRKGLLFKLIMWTAFVSYYF